MKALTTGEFDIIMRALDDFVTLNESSALENDDGKVGARFARRAIALRKKISGGKLLLGDNREAEIK